MKKHFLFYFFSIFLFSCDLNYNGEERILFEGRVVDENGNPMHGVYVSAQANLDSNFLFHPSDEDIISYDYTDENGNFKMIFPSPVNETEMQLFINYEEQSPDYSKVNFYNIQDENYQNYKIDFEIIELYPVEESVLLTIEVENNFSYQVIGWNLDGKVAENLYNYSPLEVDSNVHFHNSSQKMVGKNQILTLSYYYTQNNSPEIRENVVQIEINDQPVTYEITL